MKLDYYVYRPQNRKFYLYRLGCDPRCVGRTTKKTTRSRAERWVREHLEELQTKVLQPSEGKKKDTLNLIEYAKDFYTWDKCPHVARYRADGKSITKDHVKIARGRLKNYIFPHPIAQKQLKDITIDDVENFKIDLRTKANLSRSSANRVMSVLKVIFNEAYHRKHLTYNPTEGVGRIKEDSEERGIFAPYELAVLFPDESPGPWAYHEVYTCFLLAATTGLCRGEILGCRRKRIDFDRKLISVEEAKKVSGMGSPKWNRYREIPLIPSTITALKKLLDESPFKDPDDFIFYNMQRQSRGFTWWKKNFTKTIDKFGWDRKGRNLTPHSFRHTVVSYLRSQGYDLDLIQKVIGHSGGKREERRKREVTNIYTHWQEYDTRPMMNSIRDLFLIGKVIVSLNTLFFLRIILGHSMEIKSDGKPKTKSNPKYTA